MGLKVGQTEKQEKLKSIFRFTVLLYMGIPYFSVLLKNLIYNMTMMNSGSFDSITLNALSALLKCCFLCRYECFDLEINELDIVCCFYSNQYLC